jgi:hypothetical protein
MSRSLAAQSLLLVAPAMALAQSSAVDRLAWMAGCWEQRAPGRVVTEMWMPPAGGAMMGASRTISNNTAGAFEQLRIVARGDTLVYIAQPSGQTLTEFKRTSVTDIAVRFENPSHDFPRAIVYAKSGSDSIVASIEGPGANNTTRTIRYPMVRVSCTARAAPPPARDTPASMSYRVPATVTRLW